MIPIMTTQKNSSGFVVLYAVLIAGMLLSVGLSIFNITLKETIFATVARDSNTALYAADSGRECALYWDFKYNGSGGSGTGGLFITNNSSTLPVVGEAKCNEQDIVSLWGTPVTDATSAITVFRLTFSNNSCAEVSVNKSSASGNMVTTVVSRGYNTCSASYLNRVERALVATY